MYLLGYDIGSSSIKATLLEAATGKTVASATSPRTEMEIIAVKPGWAEQHPHTWWDHIRQATAQITTQAPGQLAQVAAIGISYQMHGLVLVDKNQQVLRPAIIWCDSRAVPIGEKAFADLGPKLCLQRFLNSPGNFTASKMKWVMENEPEVFKKVAKLMLPGDYIAMRMTGEVKTTPSGLSEGILWDFQDQAPAARLLDYYRIPPTLLPEVVPTFSVHGTLGKAAAEELGLKSGIPIAYRAGDQPNNALSLKVLEPGEIAATAGTSGVVYGISDKGDYDSASRVNTFVHVNHRPDQPRYGVLLCLNGTGILNSWTKHNVMASGQDYAQMNALASQAPVGSDGLCILPYGNGAERTLKNRDIGASVHRLNFNTHKQSHWLRAVQEGIVFALNYGLAIMREVGVQVRTVRAGHANMFLSPLFAQAFATVTGAHVELYNTDGAQGAARGAGLGAGLYRDGSQAFVGLTSVKTIEPNPDQSQAYQDAYHNWLAILEKQLN